MRNHLIRAAAGQQQGVIEFVDSFSAAVGVGSDITLNLTNLTGLALGDVVYVAAAKTEGSDLNWTATAGWTEISDLYQSDTASCNFTIYRKVQSGSVDTSVNLDSNGTNGTMRAVAIAFRGVDNTTPEDATTVNRQVANTNTPNPSAITTVTSGAAILTIAGGATVSTTSAYTAPSGYVGMVQAAASTDCICGACYQLDLPIGSENPGAWGGGDAIATSSYCCSTIALRPA